MNISSRHSAAGNDGGTTREKILQGACELFAHQGFGQTTVQAICEKAGSNIASVNYHFGGKGNLYIESWAHAAKVSGLVDGPIADDLPPEEWVRQIIHQRIQAIFSDGPAGWFPRLIHHEIHNQTPYFNDIRNRFLQTVRMKIAKQLSLYLGPQATPLQVESAVAGMMGFLPMIIELREHRKSPLSPGEIAQLTRQTQAYVLGGLAAVKRLIHKEAL